jgi:hypothetical protein
MADMKRLSNGSIEIEPYDPCYCGSDEKVKFCHPTSKRGEIPRPSASNCKPPGSPTGFAHPGCYARQLNDCSTEMSGEHLFSEVMLNLVRGGDGKVSREGYPWQVEGEVQSLSPSSCKANVLCKRHNNALSPLDAVGGRFLKTILNTPDFLQHHNLRVLMLSGDDFERWMLKTLCTHTVAVRKFGSDWVPPMQGLEMLWNMNSFPPGCGLYFNHEIGQASAHQVRLRLHVLTSSGISGPSGTIIGLAGHEFALAMVPPSSQQQPDSVLIPRFYRPSDIVITCGKSEVVYSFGWTAPVTPQRIALSWAPNQ